MVSLSGYLLHEIALFFNLCAFNVVIQFWTKTLPFSRSSNNYIKIFAIALIIINSILLLLSVIITVIYGLHCDTSICNNVFIAELSVDGFSLLLLSTYMLVLGMQLQSRIGLQNGKSLVIKINIVLMLITFCYILRVVFEVYIICVTFNHTNTDLNVIYNNELLWFICSKWIPFIIPAIMLLHLMRPRRVDMWGKYEENVIIQVKYDKVTSFDQSSLIDDSMNSSTDEIIDNSDYMINYGMLSDFHSNNHRKSIASSSHSVSDFILGIFSMSYDEKKKYNLNHNSSMDSNDINTTNKTIENNSLNSTNRLSSIDNLSSTRIYMKPSISIPREISVGTSFTDVNSRISSLDQFSPSMKQNLFP